MKYLRNFHCEYCQISFFDFGRFQEHRGRHKRSYLFRVLCLKRRVKHLRTSQKCTSKSHYKLYVNGKAYAFDGTMLTVKPEHIQIAVTSTEVGDFNKRSALDLYLCTFCQMRYPSNIFMQHRQTDHTCPLCGDSFRYEALSYHIESEHRCCYCRACLTKKDLERHLAEKHRCNVCCRYFTSESLEQHKKSIHRCPYCDKNLHYKNLICHIGSSHFCVYCSVNYSDLRFHLEREHKCKLCACGTNYLSRKHLPPHAQAKQSGEHVNYQCRICKKIYSTCELNWHYKIIQNATANRACATCGERIFKERKYSPLHGPPSLPCAFCKELFYSQRELLSHWTERERYGDIARTRSSIKAHTPTSKDSLGITSCAICKKANKSDCHFAWHMQNRRGKDAKYSCQNCRRTFGNKRELIHHEMLAIHCAYCKQSFEKLAQLMSHWRERQKENATCPCALCSEGEKVTHSLFRCKFCQKCFAGIKYVKHRHCLDDQCPYCN